MGRNKSYGEPETKWWVLLIGWIALVLGFIAFLTLFLCLFNGPIEVHHYKITDLASGKTYIAEKNDFASDVSISEGRRYIEEHLGPGISFTLHDGSEVEIDNSFSCVSID